MATFARNLANLVDFANLANLSLACRKVICHSRNVVFYGFVERRIELLFQRQHFVVRCLDQAIAEIRDDAHPLFRAGAYIGVHVHLVPKECTQRIEFRAHAGGEPHGIFRDFIHIIECPDFLRGKLPFGFGIQVGDEQVDQSPP